MKEESESARRRQKEEDEKRLAERLSKMAPGYWKRQGTLLHLLVLFQGVCVVFLMRKALAKYQTRSTLKPCSHWTFPSAVTWKFTVTGFCVILQCVPTQTYIPQRLQSFLQRGRGRFTARSCSRCTFQISYSGCAEVFCALFPLVSFTSQLRLIDRVSLPCVPLDCIVILQRSCGT